MASIMKCVNGHFYDADKSKTCPYCAQQSREPLINRNIQFYNGNPAEADFEADDNSKTMAMPVQQSYVDFGDPGRPAGVEGLGLEGESVTVGFLSKAAGTAYVTGWLVGRTGAVKGRDYRVYPNINWIGYGFGADLRIPEAHEIHEKQQCAIIYDWRSNRFFLQPGMGTITYLNGEVLDGPRQISLGDEITMGGLLFEFVPFCREGHVWETEVSQKSVN